MNLIDINKLLAPISAELPCGVAAEEFPAYNEISYLRKSDEEGNNDDRGWSFQPRQAEWAKVKSSIINMLENDSKDLQLLCWLAESLMQLFSLPGLSEGISIINSSLIKYWDCLHPFGKNNEPYREGLLNGLDRLIARYLHIFPLDADKEISLSNWNRVQTFEQRIVKNPELKDSLLKQKYIPLKEWKRKVAVFLQSYPAKIDTVTSQLDILYDELEKIDASVKKYSECINDVFKETFSRIHEIHDFIRQLFPVSDGVTLENNIMPEGTEIENFGTSGGDMANSCENIDGKIAYIQQRALSISQLKDIITIFRDNEPSSPVPYLLERAIRWANMNMLEFLADIYNNESTHYAVGVQAIFGPQFAQNQDLLPPLPPSPMLSHANAMAEKDADFRFTEHDTYEPLHSAENVYR